MSDVVRSLYNRYRPETWEEIVGNEDVVDGVRKLVERPEGPPNSFLFVGGSGTGKTTISRIIKNVLEVSDQDYKELDISNMRGIDHIRELREKSMFKPIRSAYRIYLLDEVHRATKDAQEAMLKWLEDCPKHAIIILATTDPQNLLPTILTRCNKFQMSNLSQEELTVLIEWVAENENVSVPEKVVRKIARTAEGSPRNALTLLENVIGIEDEDKAIKILDCDVAGQSAEVLDLCRMLLDKRTTWKQYQSVISALKEDAEGVRVAVLGYMNSVAMKQKDEKVIRRAISIMECFADNYFNSKKAGLTLSCYEAFIRE